MTYRYFADTTDHYALMDAARARANELRDEALDAVWDAAAEQARRAVRSATRLAHRLLRHQRLRARKPLMG